MTGYSVTTGSQLKCPHGGTVQIVTSNTRVKVNGSALALSNDTFTISGCSFQLPTPVPTPSPCVSVMWILPDLRSKVNKNATLSQSSVGLCLSGTQIPQGPVVITPAQAKVKSQ